MERKKINILIFSPSARKVWVQPLKKVLNPSYWLLAYLAARLSDIYNVFTITKSFDPVSKVKQYNDEKIDIIVSIGASYNPATLKAEFNKGFPMHERAFEIGEITKKVNHKFNPYHVNINVDVRKWFDGLTEVFGIVPDEYITEQEMEWQKVGFLLNNKIYSESRKIKNIDFFFSGGVKSRQKQFLEMTKTLPFQKQIDGGGWDKYLKIEDGFVCNGFIQWFDSVQKMIRAKYSVTLHEPLGHNEGWITAKMFENMGARVVNFIHSDYDKYNLYLPKDYLLRVSTSDEIIKLTNEFGYNELLEYQNKFINKEWANLEKFYVQPFFKRFEKSIEQWAEQRK